MPREDALQIVRSDASLVIRYVWGRDAVDRTCAVVIAIIATGLAAVMGFTVVADVPFLQVLIAVAYGIGMYVLASVMNVTDVRLDERRLAVRTRPFPWRRPFQLALPTISRFDMERAVIGDYGEVPISQANSKVGYNAIAVATDGSRRVVLERVTRHADASNIHEELDRHLHELKASPATTAAGGHGGL